MLPFWSDNYRNHWAKNQNILKSLKIIHFNNLTAHTFSLSYTVDDKTKEHLLSISNFKSTKCMCCQFFVRVPSYINLKPFVSLTEIDFWQFTDFLSKNKAYYWKYLRSRSKSKTLSKLSTWVTRKLTFSKSQNTAVKYQISVVT